MREVTIGVSLTPDQADAARLPELDRSHGGDRKRSPAVCDVTLVDVARRVRIGKVFAE